MKSRTIFASLLVCAAVLTTRADTVVYDNTVTPEKDSNGNTLALPIYTEAGDEVNLVGSDRTITSVQFEYYGRWVAQGDESAKIRFYLNDGAVIDIFGTRAPKTMFWESPLFPATSGFDAKGFDNLNVTIPGGANNFTVAFQFFGLANTAAEHAEMLLYDPPAIGKSFGDYWRNSPTGWVLDVPPTGAKERYNFSILLTAIPEPGTLGLVALGVIAFALALLDKTRLSLRDPAVIPIKR